MEFCSIQLQKIPCSWLFLQAKRTVGEYILTSAPLYPVDEPVCSRKWPEKTWKLWQLDSDTVPSVPASVEHHWIQQSRGEVYVECWLGRCTCSPGELPWHLVKCFQSLLGALSHARAEHSFQNWTIGSQDDIKADVGTLSNMDTEVSKHFELLMTWCYCRLHYTTG